MTGYVKFFPKKFLPAVRNVNSPFLYPLAEVPRGGTVPALLADDSFPRCPDALALVHEMNRNPKCCLLAQATKWFPIVDCGRPFTKPVNGIGAKQKRCNMPFNQNLQPVASMTSMDVPRRSAWNPKSLALLALLKGGGSKVTRRPRESAIDALRQTTFPFPLDFLMLQSKG